MEFPDADTIEGLLDPIEFPEFAVARYEPPAPETEDPAAAAREAVAALPLDRLHEGDTVAVGLGSRGIHDIVPVATAVVAALDRRGYEPVAVPAMGSHGGATAEGQREALAGLGLDEATLGCPIDARMDTGVVGEVGGYPVHAADAVREADATVVVNRVKPHTNFSGRVESGLCKMTTIGLGKQGGAQVTHRRALGEGYVPAILEPFELLRDELPLLGGVAVVENVYDRTAAVEGVPVGDLPERESDLLETAREQFPALPYDDLDALVVDRIGKDISGTGMDTNVTGRYRVLNMDDPAVPDIDRIFVRGLSEATHGNGNGIGIADVTTVDVARELDLDQMYANAITSSSVRKVRVPMALPTDRQALTAALSSTGPYDPETARVAWIRDTGHLSSFRVSTALAAEDHDHVETGDPEPPVSEDGVARPPELH
jgi:hypothetical protein